MKSIPMTSLRQDWRTPRALFQTLDAEFRFDFDPCPPDASFDGLSVEWKARNFVNPPFKGIAHWIAKGWREAKRGKVVVFLIPARTCTAWWHDYVLKAAEIRFIRGRIKYEGAKFNAPFPSCVVIFKQGHEPAAIKALRWAISKGDVCRCLGLAVCEAHQVLAQYEAA